MAIRFRVSLQDQFATRLKDYATGLTQTKMQAARDVARDVAIEAHEKAREMAGERLHSTKMDYLRALSFDERNGLYIITLDGSAAHLEDGYSSFPMVPGMMNSNAIVKTGKRAGQPWVRIGKDGHRYAAVPFEHNEAAAKSGHPDFDQKVRIGQPGETTKGNLARDLKQLRETFGDSGITRGPDGQAVQGKTATWVKSDMGPQWSFRDAFGNASTRTVQADPMLSGLTKFQYQVDKRGGGKVDKSAFLTWRIASEKHPDKFVHPGYRGAKVFPDLLEWTNNTLAARITELFQQQG
jgi:hypothetical protein